MDILIKIGILIIGLLVLAAMVSLLVAIIRLLVRSSAFKAGTTSQQINRNFLKAFFIQDALKQDGEASSKSVIWRVTISFLILLSMVLVVFHYLAPQIGIDS